MTDVSINTTAPVPLSSAEQLKQKIADLQAQLQTGAPGYESLLHTIHAALHKDENLTHLLSDEEVGVICAGLSKKTNTVIAEASKKSGGARTAGGKKLKDIGLDDL